MLQAPIVAGGAGDGLIGPSHISRDRRERRFRGSSPDKSYKVGPSLAVIHHPTVLHVQNPAGGPVFGLGGGKPVEPGLNIVKPLS